MKKIKYGIVGYYLYFIMFYLIKKKLFWIFYTLIFIIITSLFSAWSIIEIYTGGDWGKIL